MSSSSETGWELTVPRKSNSLLYTQNSFGKESLGPLSLHTCFCIPDFVDKTYSQTWPRKVCSKTYLPLDRRPDRSSIWWSSGSPQHIVMTYGIFTQLMSDSTCHKCNKQDNRGIVKSTGNMLIIQIVEFVDACLITGFWTGSESTPPWAFKTIPSARFGFID